jgi:hypothetical protein
MSWSHFETYLQDLAKGNRKDQLCIVCGAGIHGLVSNSSTGAEYEASKMLSSWNKLLDVICTNVSHAPSTILHWEMELLSLNKDANDEKAAFLNEKKLISRLQEKLKASEVLILKNALIKELYAPIRQLLLSPLVNDVVSLNMDLVLEALLDTKHSFAKQVEGDTYTLNRKRVIKRSTPSDQLRIWHPHGDRQSEQSIAMGMWRYSRLIKALASRRGHYKMVEKKNRDAFDKKVNNDPDTWFDIYMRRPLLFIGTGLATAEWSQWIALLLRWRNHAKITDNDKIPPIWHLSVPSDGLHLPKDQFKRLEAPNYETGWKYLTQIFERCEKMTMETNNGLNTTAES